MRKILVFTIIAFMLVLAAAIVVAAPYQKNPSGCLNNYQSQNCLGGTYSCGWYGGFLFCNSTSEMNAVIPSSNYTQTGANYPNSSLGGGFVMDCLSTSASYCTSSNWQCQTDSACYGTKFRDTICLAGTTNAACGSCRTNYNDCDTDSDVCEIFNTATCGVSARGTYFGCFATPGSGVAGNCTCRDQAGSSSSYWDCDSSGATIGDGCETLYHGTSGCGSTGAWYTGCNVTGTNGVCSCQTNYYDCDSTGAGGGNGCEVLNGAACSQSGVAGTWNGPSCTCVPGKSNFVTGELKSYLSTDPLIWGKQFGTGPLINFSNSTGGTFLVTNNACITFPDNTTQCSASVGSGGGSIWTNSSGNAVFTSGSVGIGTTNPTQKLDVNGSVNVTGSIFSPTISSMPNLSYANIVSGVGNWSLDKPSYVTSTILNTTFLKLTGGNVTGAINLATSSGNVGIGTTNASTTLDVNGTVTVRSNLNYYGNLSGYGADFAERMPTAENVSAGDVVCLNDDLKIIKCSEKSQTSVMGVVSDNPTIIGNSNAQNSVPVGIVGIVKTKVKGPVKRFNLLTTSTQKGYAEKASNEEFGAIVGKAMEPCDMEQCYIKVLVGLR